MKRQKNTPSKFRCSRAKRISKKHGKNLCARKEFAHGKTCSSNADALKQLTTKVTTNSVLAYKHKTFSSFPNGIVSRFDFFERIFITLSSFTVQNVAFHSPLCPKGRVWSGIRICVVRIFWILIFASHINNASFIGYKDNFILLSFISYSRRRINGKKALSSVVCWHVRL